MVLFAFVLIGKLFVVCCVVGGFCFFFSRLTSEVNNLLLAPSITLLLAFLRSGWSGKLQLHVQSLLPLCRVVTERARM